MGARHRVAPGKFLKRGAGRSGAFLAYRAVLNASQLGAVKISFPLFQENSELSGVFRKVRGERWKVEKVRVTVLDKKTKRPKDLDDYSSIARSAINNGAGTHVQSTLLRAS